jgi:protein-S-isoprenylcysteine O-methyltransferase Ste14
LPLPSPQRAMHISSDFSLLIKSSQLPPEEDRPGIPIAPPLLFVIPILMSLALEWFARTSFVHGMFRWILGALLFLAGIALNVSGFITQRRAGTDPIPFNPSTRIVTHGLYRFTRNPMYIGFALWTLALAILIDSAWTLLAVPIGLVLIDRIVITREERYLERKFGEEYLNYKRRVRRWI